jgi:serine protease AprX
MNVTTSRRACATLAATLLVLGGAVPAHAAGAHAAHRPARHATEAIVQFDPQVARQARVRAVRAAGGRSVRDLHLISGLAVRISARGARRLAHAPGVRAVTPNAPMRPTAAPPGGPAAANATTAPAPSTTAAPAAGATTTTTSTATAGTTTATASATTAGATTTTTSTTTAGATTATASATTAGATTTAAAPATSTTPASAGGRFGAWDPAALATTFARSTRADTVWTDPRAPTTGDGVAVAVIDTGIAGDLPDFRVSSTDPTSRVIVSAVSNPDARTATDLYGHGTHVAGLVAGNGRALAPDDPLYNRYIGSAPQANLVSIKASDDHGRSSIADVIAGLQFAVEHRADYGIRVVNLSLVSSLSQSYKVDPLDAAVEAAWFHGLVVVAAAGNDGDAPGAVSHSPGNDPYAITVGAVDDHGTKETIDDTLASWSSRGVTQDGFAKPDVVAPGVHVASTLAPGSDFIQLCPTCVVDGSYFQLSGTSMAAPIVAGIAADLIAAHPTWSPDQVKGALTYDGGRVSSGGAWAATVRPTAEGQDEVAADLANRASPTATRSANGALVPNDLIDPATGDVDETRASWGRASWGAAADGLRASWGRASWGCDCSAMTGVDYTRASWGRASWGSFFGESPADFGELRGGNTGTTKRLANAPAATPWAPADQPAAPAPAADASAAAAAAAAASHATTGPAYPDASAAAAAPLVGAAAAPAP